MIDIGILADFEGWRKEQRRRELIGTYRDIYGDKMPDNILTSLESELEKIVPVADMDFGKMQMKDVCFLAWKSEQRTRPTATLEEVSASINLDNLESRIKELFGGFAAELPTKKKRPRSPLKRQ